jgi:hypothetical protein
MKFFFKKKYQLVRQQHVGVAFFSNQSQLSLCNIQGLCGASTVKADKFQISTWRNPWQAKSISSKQIVQKDT